MPPKDKHPDCRECRDQARCILEAAAPHMLSHEREETRLAHVDAVVNRDTVDRLERELDEAKANAWDEGFASGKSRAMRYMSDEPNLPLSAPNPYRSNA